MSNSRSWKLRLQHTAHLSTCISPMRVICVPIYLYVIAYSYSGNKTLGNTNKQIFWLQMLMHEPLPAILTGQAAANEGEWWWHETCSVRTLFEKPYLLWACYTIFPQIKFHWVVSSFSEVFLLVSTLDKQYENDRLFEVFLWKDALYCPLPEK